MLSWLVPIALISAAISASILVAFEIAGKRIKDESEDQEALN